MSCYLRTAKKAPEEVSAIDIKLASTSVDVFGGHSK